MSGPYNIIFPAGITRAGFNVSIKDDNLLENNEIFTLAIDILSLPSEVNATDPSQVEVTIMEDDCKK